MKPLKENTLTDLRVEIIKEKQKYIAEAIRFRQRILEEKEKTTDLRKQKSR